MELFNQSLSWMALLSWLQALRGDGFLIKNIRLEKCLHASSHEAEKIGLADCKPQSLSYEWLWDPAARAVVSQKTGECLTASEPQELALVHLEACGGDRRVQAWACSKKGHLTLQGSGLHLSTKPGGQKAFLSREKGKFSRWTTAREGAICATDHLGADPGFSDLTLWVPESKMTALPPVHILSVDTTTTPPGAPWEDEDNATRTLLMNESIDWTEDQDRYDLHKKNHQRKAVASQQSGSNWVTVMLVLSPLAFIVGVIILLTNIHHNKKKKALSALQTRQAVHEEGRPLPGLRNVRPEPQNAAPSPSFRHGEILIEWKDGTITPLFNSTIHQIC